MGEFVELMQSTKGIYPIARYRLNQNESYTFCYTGVGRKDKEMFYYSCIQCKKVDGKTRGKVMESVVCYSVHFANEVLWTVSFISI
jgi:hypothetical protein